MKLMPTKVNDLTVHVKKNVFLYPYVAFTILVFNQGRQLYF